MEFLSQIMRLLCSSQRGLMIKRNRIKLGVLLVQGSLYQLSVQNVIVSHIPALQTTTYLKRRMSLRCAFHEKEPFDLPRGGASE